MTTAQLRTQADQAARRHGIAPALLRAVVTVESRWNPQSYRYEPGFWRKYMAGKPQYKGADPRRVSASYGLGQLMYATAVQEGYRGRPEGLYDPAVNLDLAARHIRRLWSRYGNARDVAAAYNSGQPFSKAPAFTRNTHVPKVLRALASELGTTPAPTATDGRRLAAYAGAAVVALAALLAA